MTWTQERTEIAKRLWLEGLSAENIACRLGIPSRNAVIGKMHRLGLSRNSSETMRAHGRMSGKRVQKQRREKSGYAPAPKPVVRVDAVCLPLPKEDNPKGPLVLFADLEPHHCRAPYGEVGKSGFGFCGRDKVPGTSYCAEHHARFTVSPNINRRSKPTIGDEFSKSGRLIKVFS